MRATTQALKCCVVASLVVSGLAVHISVEPKPLDKVAEVRVPVSLLRGSASAALSSFAGAEADSEVGVDLGLDLGLEQESSHTKGDPATLAEYCAGPTSREKQAKLAEGTKVKADWKEYGTMYPGKIQEKNADGTVDVKYDDGMTEKNVDAGDIKVRKKQGLVQLFSPRDDPACKLQDFLGKLQNKLKDLNEMITQWLAGQRAKMASEDAPPTPPPSVTVPPPAPSPQAQTVTEKPSESQAEALEKLKAKLSDLDAYIKELEAEEKKYDKKIQAKIAPNAAPSAAPGVKTVDQLIAEYQAKISERQARVHELLQRIKEQKKELARLGESQLSLKDIDAAVKELEKDLEEGKKKRDELKKAGELDPELRAIIDEIIKALSKTRAKVDNLLALEAKAKEEAEKAEKEAEEAAEAARKKARLEGKDEDAAAAEAHAAAKKKSAEKARKADLDTMEAAQDVTDDLKNAEKGATKLDTGLHPHGDRWWRYRYEHSYIEALIMIFISFLMLFWSEVWRKLKDKMASWAEAGMTGVAMKTPLEELQEETHGVIYIEWLHCLADQMLVCIFVFLTVWLIAKTQLVEVFPYLIKPSSDMHVPHTGEEYRRLALDICTIFFFAIVFYFGLMFSVAHEINNTSTEIDKLERARQDKTDLMSARKSMVVQSVQSVMGNVTDNSEHYSQMYEHFADIMNQAMVVDSEDQELKEVSRLVDDDFHKFPLGCYLNMNVRVTGTQLFSFAYHMWLPTIALFMSLCLLHRFAHMGYVRIMGVAAIIVLLLLVSMAWFTKAIIRRVYEEDREYLKHVKTIHETTSTESIILYMLEFALFFVCYGVARMICQPWMWHLHFWPVFSLTIVAIISAALFVFIVAPGIPSFICAMAMPPYIDPYNMAMMKQAAMGLRTPASEKKSSPRPSIRRNS